MIFESGAFKNDPTFAPHNDGHDAPKVEIPRGFRRVSDEHIESVLQKIAENPRKEFAFIEDFVTTTPRIPVGYFFETLRRMDDAHRNTILDGMNHSSRKSFNIFQRMRSGIDTVLLQPGPHTLDQLVLTVGESKAYCSAYFWKTLQIPKEDYGFTDKAKALPPHKNGERSMDKLKSVYTQAVIDAYTNDRTIPITAARILAFWRPPRKPNLDAVKRFLYANTGFVEKVTAELD